MSLREQLNENPLAVGGVAAALLCVAALLWVMSRPEPYPSKAYYFDLNTGRLSIGPAAQIVPFDTESGSFAYGAEGAAGAGVEAMVMACDESIGLDAGMTPDDIAGLGAKLVYVRRFPLSAAAALTAAAERGEPPTLDAGYVIATPVPDQWVPVLSGGGRKILATAQMPCDIREVKLLIP